MAHIFSIPQNIVTGTDAVRMSMDLMRGYGKKVLIVTDKHMVSIGNVKLLTDELDKISIKYEIYPGINAEPTDIMIDEGVKTYTNSQCEFLIGIGGGSPIDAMKAIGAVVTNGGSIRDYQGKKIEHRLPPTVAIPTTAGTGSEATKVSIITNTKTGVKMLLSSARLMANLAVIDPVFTLTLPPAVTVSTGVDALTHAIEAYTSLKAFQMTDLYATSAIRKIFDNLYEVYKHGDNIQARREMAIAALEAGIAFSNASVTIVHGMSRPIGALFHVPHGDSNAMLLNVCLKFVQQGAQERLCDLAKAIGVYRPGMRITEGADAFVTATIALLRTLDVKTIQDFDVDQKVYFSQIQKMTQDALDSGSPANTRRTPSAGDIETLYKDLWVEGLYRAVI